MRSQFRSATAIAKGRACIPQFRMELSRRFRNGLDTGWTEMGKKKRAKHCYIWHCDKPGPQAPQTQSGIQGCPRTYHRGTTVDHSPVHAAENGPCLRIVGITSIRDGDGVKSKAWQRESEMKTPTWMLARHALIIYTRRREPKHTSSNRPTQIGCG